MATPTYRVRVVAVDEGSAAATLHLTALDASTHRVDDSPAFTLRIALDAFDRALHERFALGESTLPCSADELRARAQSNPLRDVLVDILRRTYGYERATPLDSDDVKSLLMTGLLPNGEKWFGRMDNNTGKRYPFIRGNFDLPNELAPAHVRKVILEQEKSVEGGRSGTLHVTFVHPALAAALVPGLQWEVYF